MKLTRFNSVPCFQYMSEIERDAYAVELAVLKNQVVNLVAKQADDYERRLTELRSISVKLDGLAEWRNEIDQWRARLVGIGIGIGLTAGATGGTVAGLLSHAFK